MERYSMFMDEMNQCCQFLDSVLYWSMYAIPLKIPAIFFVDIGKLILNIVWKGKRPKITKQFRKTKSEDWLYLISRNSLKLQLSRQCSTGERKDTKMRHNRLPINRLTYIQSSDLWNSVHRENNLCGVGTTVYPPTFKRTKIYR